MIKDKDTKVRKGTTLTPYVLGTPSGVLVAVSLVVCVLAARPGTAPQATAPGTTATTAAAGAVAPQAVLDRYCATCHSDRTRAGGLALEKRRVSDAAGDPQIWEKVIRKVETGMMPPSGAPRPDRASL